MMRVSAEVLGDDGGMVKAIDGVIGRTRNVMKQVADSAAGDIQEQARANIAGAGNFGSRWTDGFNVTVSDDNDGNTITATMGVPYWGVFQYGATIRGNPLLWIPFTKGGGTASGGTFTVQSKRGLLLLGDRATGTFLRFAKESVKIPKKFSIIEIADKIAQGIPEKLDEALAGGMSDG
jgi:hypothetical protein